ncbi:hypothetical protein BH18ACI5_BH18ACI5_23280 [soil metagenome]
MLTRAVIGLSIILTILAALLAPKLMKERTADEVIADHDTTPGAVAVPYRVEVQQQIVRAVETTEARRTERPASPAVRKTVKANIQAAPATFMQRATRTLLGDGRHRPEPFPRAR